jgi:tRNA (cytidine/uridine-2'-O-)-methyltransferase
MALSVALIQPQIPPNTGNIARLCAATDTALHLIGPLGFSLDDDEVRRAGLDYWDEVDVWVHPVWGAFRDAVARERCLYFSAHGRQSYLLAPYATNSVLVFGNETEGMPERIREKHPDRVYRIPMRTSVRNLNLATAVGIVVYEAIRQLRLPLDGDPGTSPRARSGAVVEGEPPVVDSTPTLSG